MVGWPALSRRDAERVLRIVRGQNGGGCQHDAHILGEAALGVQWIKRKTAARTPGQRRDMLRDEAKNIAAAINSIKGLPPTLQRDLQREYDRTVAELETITVKRSGGKQRGPGGGRIEAAQKRAAADCSINILLTWCSKTPTLTVGGPYHKLTALLFELATGKVGDVEEACARVFKERGKRTSARTFEMFAMLFEDDDEPKIFEDSD
jgi:hypothetical protein